MDHCREHRLFISSCEMIQAQATTSNGTKVEGTGIDPPTESQRTELQPGLSTEEKNDLSDLSIGYDAENQNEGLFAGQGCCCRPRKFNIAEVPKCEKRKLQSA